jgi:hypothetical protein
LNPIAINKESQDINKVIEISEEEEKWSNYLSSDLLTDAMFPICISAPHIDTRIRSQSGVFTLH